MSSGLNEVGRTRKLSDTKYSADFCHPVAGDGDAAADRRSWRSTICDLADLGVAGIWGGFGDLGGFGGRATLTI
jgi:hypothetical protein